MKIPAEEKVLPMISMFRPVELGLGSASTEKWEDPRLEIQSTSEMITPVVAGTVLVALHWSARSSNQGGGRGERECVCVRMIERKQ